MADYEARLKAVGEAEEVVDLLQHFGWTEVLKPKIMKVVDLHIQLLPSLVLNPKHEEKLGITKEAVAARVDAYLYVIGTIEEILKKGTAAFDAINSTLRAPTEQIRYNKTICKIIQ